MVCFIIKNQINDVTNSSLTFQVQKCFYWTPLFQWSWGSYKNKIGTFDEKSATNWCFLFCSKYCIYRYHDSSIENILKQSLDDKWFYKRNERQILG